MEQERRKHRRIPAVTVAKEALVESEKKKGSESFSEKRGETPHPCPLSRGERGKYK